MNKSLVIAHRADFDGLCSMEIAKRFLGKTADYLGWDYNDPLPDLEGRQIVYVIDLSLPKAMMDKNKEKLIWIDHHKTAIDDNDPAIAGIRIEGVAACRLAWQFFFGTEFGLENKFPAKERFTQPLDPRKEDRPLGEPYGVRLLGEYDIWNKTNPETDIYQVGLASFKTVDWNKIFTNDRDYLKAILANGEVIWEYNAVQNAQISTERAFDVKWEGYTFRALNTARSNSLTFTASIKEHHDGCLSYSWNGELWKFSIYGVEHKKDINFSTIAKKYGGGGHPQACGFTLKTLPDSLGWPAGSTAS